jgi:hypothetical protein
MSLDGGAQKTKEKSRPGSHAKEGSSFKVTTAIVIPLLAIIIPAIVAIYIAKTSGASSVSQPRSSASSSSLSVSPASPAPQGRAGVSASATASATATATGPAKTATAPAVAVRHAFIYHVTGLALDNHGCDNHNVYSVAIFDPNGFQLIPDTPEPPAGVFGVELFCSATTSGSGLDPNLEYADDAAIPPANADFNSCYAAILNSPVHGSIPFGNLRPGGQLCILKGDELALVSLRSVSQAEYRLTGTVTVWRVLTGG